MSENSKKVEFGVWLPIVDGAGMGNPEGAAMAMKDMRWRECFAARYPTTAREEHVANVASNGSRTGERGSIVELCTQSASTVRIGGQAHWRAQGRF